MSRNAITSAPGAPDAVGPYSYAVRTGDLIFFSGQTPLDPATGKLVTGDITAQTERVFMNLEAVLHAASRTFADVVKVNVFLVDMADFAAMNAVYATKFEAPYPARSTVAVAALPVNARVEIELVAR
jgi:2-iminobutanoate/2-iminopropanoate deaminase